MTSRISAIRDAIMSRKGSFVTHPNPMAMPVAVYRAMQKPGSRGQLRANILLEQVTLTPVEIGPLWTLAGEHLPRANTWDVPIPELSCPDVQQHLLALGVAESEWPELARSVAEWKQMGRCYAVGDADPDQLRGQFNLGAPASTGVFMAGGWAENHSVRDFAKVIRMGFHGLRQEIMQRLTETPLSHPDRVRSEQFWRAALTVCEAGALLGQRYAEQALACAQAATDSVDQDRLLRMAATCQRVPAYGARTFREAVQSLWLTHILTCGEDGINANSIGRLDQILWPWYQTGIEEGSLTREMAVEIMAEFACKLYLEYDVQAITLGGQDRHGRDAVNALSYVILDATEQVDFIRDLSVRLHSGSPEPFVRRAAQLIQRGGGIPFLFNDDCFIPALTERGIALEDARDYAPIGCIELTIPGRAIPHAVSGWINALKCLELALFDGVDPASGLPVGPQTGSLADMRGFEDFYAAFMAQLRFFTERMVYACNRGELLQREYGPLPCWSVMTDDCIARGRDITDEGAVYNYHSICFMGTANTADALMAMKQLLFEERRIDSQALLEALRINYHGQEAMRQLLVHKAPKYGNDLDDVDQMAARVASDFIGILDEMRSPLNGRYVAHLFTFKLNIEFGHATGATPDGRCAGEPLAYSLSAHQGRDQTGVTAMLRSLAKLPHHKSAGATAAIIDLDPSLLEGSSGIDVLTQLIRSAVAMGVGQLQWNVTTVERLEQAKQDPERFGNIPVRVAGYSQMFRLIEPELQDHIIARTKHRH